MGLFSLEKALGRPYAAFQYLKGAYKKDRERLFMKACSDRTRRNFFTLKEGRFRLDIGREEIFYEGGETLEQVAQGTCRYPIIRNV